MWALLGVVLVLVVGGGAFALGSLANGKDRVPTSTGKPVSAPASGAGGPSHGPKAAAKRGRAAPTGPGRAVAHSLSKLIDDSTKDKTAVGAAVAYLDSCRKVQTSVRTLDAAARSRSDLVTRAKKIDDQGVAGASNVVTDLVAAWQTSAKADSAFSDFGRSLHRNAKGKCVGNKSWRSRGVKFSTQSHPPKQAAAKAWNRLAKTYGLATIQWGQL